MTEYGVSVTERAREALQGVKPDGSGLSIELIAEAIQKAIAAEREACARTAEAHQDRPINGHICEDGGCDRKIADAIRART